MKSLAAVLVVLTLATPVAALSNGSVPPSSPSAFPTAHGEVLQLSYRVLVAPNQCLTLTGAQFLHPGGARLPLLLNTWEPTRVLSVKVTTVGKSQGATLLLNGFATATDADGLVRFPDGLLMSGPLLNAQVYNPASVGVAVYIVVQVQQGAGQ